MDDLGPCCSVGDGQAKEDEICELHERLERYEALLRDLGATKVV